MQHLRGGLAPPCLPSLKLLERILFKSHHIIFIMYNLYKGFYILAQFKHSNYIINYRNSLEYGKKPNETMGLIIQG